MDYDALTLCKRADKRVDPPHEEGRALSPEERLRKLLAESILAEEQASADAGLGDYSNYWWNKY